MMDSIAGWSNGRANANKTYRRLKRVTHPENPRMLVGMIITYTIYVSGYLLNG